LAQYRELEAFAQFAADLDKNTQAQLARGERTVEILKQGTLKTWPVEEQVAVIFAVTQGLMDQVPVDDIKVFEAALVENLRAAGGDVLAEIRTSKVLSDEVAGKLRKLTGDFVGQVWSKRAEKQGG
ncbi:MAG: F0F1 ATP synthase subunit alpha, partial [Planctomycetes bacterium]|nr:F0F1 ATP synthase subunit alpha [Planctomycetota bacterium]